MGHLIDQPASPLQRAIQYAQRTIAIAVVGCAALALWAGPASAADTPLPDPTAAAATSDVQVSAPPAPAPDVQTVANQVSDTVATATPQPADAATPAPIPDLPQIAAPVPATSGVRAAAPEPSRVISDVTSKASASINTAVPGADAVNATKVASKASAAPAIHALPADPVKQIPFGVSGSSDLDGAAVSIPDLGGPAGSADQSSADPSGIRNLREGLTPPRSTAGPGSISVTIRHVVSIARALTPTVLLTTGAPADAGSSAAPSPAATDTAPGLPSLPGPLQIPVLGASSSSTTPSSGFFFFGFAGLLVGLWAAFAPASSRRLQGPPASWRPAPYLSLLELPG